MAECVRSYMSRYNGLFLAIEDEEMVRALMSNL